MKKVIAREVYLNKIRPYINKSIIKVITGQRRVGKSYILYQLINEFKLNKDNNVIYINKELFEFRQLINYVDLIDYIYINKNKNKNNIIIIDEVQDIIEFEKALRSLQAENEYDIYCTGSNAKLLSGELATYLSGRYIEIQVFPLNYNEFIQFHSLNENEESYQKYIRYGGHPYLIHLKLEDTIVYDYLKNIYNTILLKDIVARNNIRNFMFLEDLTMYLADNIGSLVTAKRISDYLKSQKINISNNIVLNYIAFLNNAFIVHKVRRSDIVGRKIFEIGEKYYYNDIGLRNSIVGYKINDKSKILENIVYNHLLALGYNINIGKFGDKEIDFVCEKNNEKLYIQVAYTISNQKVIDREFGNLLLIKDNYKKIVISEEKFEGNTFKGIEHCNIRNFLLNFK